MCKKNNFYFSDENENFTENQNNSINEKNLTDDERLDIFDTSPNQINENVDFSFDSSPHTYKTNDLSTSFADQLAKFNEESKPYMPSELVLNYDTKSSNVNGTNQSFNSSDSSQSYSNKTNQYDNEQVYEDIKLSLKPPAFKKKKSSTLKKSIAVIAIGVALSFCSSFAGANLGNSFYNSNNQIEKSNDKNIVNTSTNNENSISNVAKNALASVVEITTETAVNGIRMEQFVTQGAGSGVILTSDGYIVTNNHVIDGATTINVRLSDKTTYKATLVGKDSQSDLAVLKIDAANLTPAKLGSSSDLVVGQTAVAIGNPLGELGGTVTNGIISALDRAITIDDQTMTLLQTNAAINPGNSGGGLFNLNGELIGIVNAKSSGSDIEGLGFAIPIDTAKEIINQLIENGYVSGRVTLNTSFIDVSSEMDAMKYGVSKLGAYVYETQLSNSLVRGDLILSINGTEINSTSDITSILKEFKVNDTINVTVLRNGEQHTLKITLGELKE